jgi:hypothetical protein
MPAAACADAAIWWWAVWPGLQDKIEFLVAETIDGKLDLHDSFVFDEGAAVVGSTSVVAGVVCRPEHLEARSRLSRAGGFRKPCASWQAASGLC